jgi:Na+/phosphate symporter
VNTEFDRAELRRMYDRLEAAMEDLERHATGPDKSNANRMTDLAEKVEAADKAINDYVWSVLIARGRQRAS